MREPARLRKRPEREEVPEEEREDYDLVAGRTARLAYPDYDLPARYFGALLTSPPMATRLVALGRFVREGEVRGSYSDAERELVDIVIAKDTGYNGILTVHVPDAIAVGVRFEAIDAIRSGEESALTPEERQIVDYSRAVMAGTVTDADYEAMVARLGERGALEFTGFVTFLLMTVRNWQAIGVPNPTDEEIDELIEGLRSGRAEIPDPAARIG